MPLFKVFVGGLPHNIGKDEIIIYFSRFGDILKVDLPKYGKSRKLKGFGFVFFSSPCEIENVLEHGDHQIQGKRVTVRRGLEDETAQKMTKDNQYKKLYVSGFPKTN